MAIWLFEVWTWLAERPYGALVVDLADYLVLLFVDIKLWKTVGQVHDDNPLSLPLLSHVRLALILSHLLRFFAFSGSGSRRQCPDTASHAAVKASSSP